MAHAGPPVVLVVDPVPGADWRRSATAAGARKLDLDLGPGRLAVEFPAVASALACARELERGNGTHAVGVALADDPGPAAAELCARAEPGQVLVSAAAHALTVGRPGHAFRELEAGSWELLWREPEPRTRIRLCGSLELVVDGRDVGSEVPRGQAGSLLRYLLAHRGRPAERDELVDVVWPPRPPRDPSALRPILSRLRRALAPAELEGCERLRLALPEPVWVDAEEAAGALATARAAARAALWAGARVHAEAALEVLRPGFLAGEGAEWAEIQRHRLEELELEALEWLARSSLALGGADAGAAERAGRELVARAPYRETGYRFLMEALAVAGNIAEALRVYEDLRVLLRDELGVSPATDVQELHRRLLSAEPAPARAAGGRGRSRRPPPRHSAPRTARPPRGRHAPEARSRIRGR